VRASVKRSVVTTLLKNISNVILMRSCDGINQCAVFYANSDEHR
jgi:hypothetical protein